MPKLKSQEDVENAIKEKKKALENLGQEESPVTRSGEQMIVKDPDGDTHPEMSQMKYEADKPDQEELLRQAKIRAMKRVHSILSE